MDLLNLGKALNISPISVLVPILLLLLGLLYFKIQSTPAGPWGLPYLGLLPFLKKETLKVQLQNYMKKYGDVYSFTYAGKLYIHLGTIKSIKEALVTKADCFNDRYRGFSLFNSFFEDGVLTENGERWRVLRKFFVNAFREHGLSSMKDYMSGPILDSVKASVDDLRATNGAPINLVKILTTRSCEILRRAMFNDEGMSEEELKEIIEGYEKILLLFNNQTIMLNGDFAKYFIYPRMAEYKTAVEGYKEASSLLKKIIDRHEASFDKYNIRNIVDSYIKERNERRDKGDRTSEYFTDAALLSSLLQFVGDGVSAVAIFIAYIINDLLDYPEEQEKIYKELEEVIGPDRQPTLQDKNNLPYLNAFIQEVERTVTFLEIFVSVECSKPTTINGQPVPKGALLLLNVGASHRDPDTFDEPNEFKPTRYISEPGRQKAESPLLFGIGKRNCIGEPFVMIQAFLFLAAVIKNFRLVRPEGVAKKDNLDLVVEVCAHPRK